MTAWYEKLKVGDPVIVIRRYEKIIAEITRVTKTQVSADGARFMKKALGREIGASLWHGGHIEEYTEEKAKVILHKMQINKLRGRVNFLLSQIKIPNDIESLNRFISALEPLVIVSDPVTQLADEVGI